MNVEQFPDSANVYDSLAEAYAAAGKRQLAEVFYRQSLILDPDNTNALKMLDQLKAPPPEAEAGDEEEPKRRKGRRRR